MGQLYIDSNRGSKGDPYKKKDNIIKLLDQIDTSCQEGWDDDQRGNFYDIMNMTEEIKKELT